VLARYQWHGADATANIDQLLTALRAGDTVALKTAKDWGQKLALGLTQVTSVLNPSSIILGGSVAPIFNWAQAEVAETMQREFIGGFPMPVVQVSTLGLEGPALGSALLMHQRMLSVDEKVLHPGEQSVAQATGA
jgi:predicted NBD/HSP70 family sugar kinase